MRWPITLLYVLFHNTKTRIIPFHSIKYRWYSLALFCRGMLPAENKSWARIPEYSTLIQYFLYSAIRWVKSRHRYFRLDVFTLQATTSRDFGGTCIRRRGMNADGCSISNIFIFQCSDVKTRHAGAPYHLLAGTPRGRSCWDRTPCLLHKIYLTWHVMVREIRHPIPRALQREGQS